MSNTKTQIERAIAIFGSEAKLGDAAGYSQHAIWHAKTHGRVSPDMAVAIETATKGTVTRAQLRPDLWKSETPGEGKAA